MTITISAILGRQGNDDPCQCFPVGSLFRQLTLRASGRARQPAGLVRRDLDSIMKHRDHLAAQLGA